MASLWIIAVRPHNLGSLRAYFDLKYGSLVVRDVQWHRAGTVDWIEAPDGIEFDDIVADDAAILVALEDFMIRGGRRAKVAAPEPERQRTLF